MLCSECYQEIESDKEIQIKGSIFCKKCTQKPFAECYTCEVKIYRKDQIYESSISHNKGFNVWLFFNNRGNSEIVLQCGECYWKWKNQFKKWENFSKKVEKVLFFCLGLLSIWIIGLFYPNVKERLDNTPGIILFPLLIFFCFVLFVVGSFLDIMDSRYKNRKRIKKEVKKKKGIPKNSANK